MAAAIGFYGMRLGTPTSLATSGIGFYGTSFGASIQVGSYQDKTFITDAGGTSQGPELNSSKYVSASGLELNGVSVVGMESVQLVPNQSGVLNVRFTYDDAVKTQNAVLRIYDRVVSTNPASGVECRVAELIHPWDTYAVGSGVGWVLASESSPTPVQTGLNLLASPGVSGLSPNGAATTAVQHDWYFLLSASPESIGSKTKFGLFASLEYL